LWCVLTIEGNVLNYTTIRPIGVTALITPWNHPLLITIKKLAPALATGNSIIIKPSEKAPISIQHLVSAILPASGLPLGTVQCVLGAADVARSLVANEHISRIDFTGGTATGRKLAAQAGERLVPITAELGGKTAVLVCEDADLESAVDGVLAAAFIASGQTCVTGSRVIIQESVYEEVVARLVERVGELRVGRPWEMETEIGAVIDRAAVERCQRFVETARKEGAKVLIGGESTQVDGRVQKTKPPAHLSSLTTGRGISSNRRYWEIVSRPIHPFEMRFSVQ
jgi:acyl-CoA reductase-like NAD-dependent aldehyde dehydrogenase